MNTTEDNTNPDLMPAIAGQPNPIALPVQIPAPPPEPRVDAAQARVEAVATTLAAAYAQASQLKLTPEEAAALSEDFPDEAFSLGAGGDPNLVYIEHAYLRQRLNRVLGVGAAVPIRRREWAEDFSYWKDGKQARGVRVYVDLVLVVRGAVVGEAIGDSVYYPSNAKTNYSDALESAKSNAFRRCCKEFGVGLQAWMRGWVDGWKGRKASQTHSDPKPPSTTAPVAKNAPEAKPEAKTPAVATDKIKARMIELLEPVRVPATEYLVKIGWLMDNETLEDLSLSRVPTTKPEMDAVMRAIERFADGDEASEPVTMPADEQVPEGSKELKGFIKLVNSKRTAKGNLRYGILMVPDMNQKDGGEWLNSFSDTDGTTATSLKGKSVRALYTESTYGKELVEHSIKQL